MLVLASESPRRLALLAQAGIVPGAVRAAGIDETVHSRELPRPYAQRLAEAKARAAAASWEGPPALFLAADTVVSVGRRILPKAETDEEVRDCLALLSGRAHRVTTALAALPMVGKISAHGRSRPAWPSTGSMRRRSKLMCAAAKGWARPAAMPCRAAPRSSSAG